MAYFKNIVHVLHTYSLRPATLAAEALGQMWSRHCVVGTSLGPPESAPPSPLRPVVSSVRPGTIALQHSTAPAKELAHGAHLE